MSELVWEQIRPISLLCAVWLGMEIDSKWSAHLLELERQGLIKAVTEWRLTEAGQKLVDKT